MFYLCGTTIVSLLCAAILSFGVLRYTAFLPIFIFFWLYALALFGYILLVQAFFRKPTLASVVSTLFFFVSSFADILVSDPHLPEYYKILASMLPSVAIKRTIANITELEKDGRGLHFSNMNEDIGGFRVTTAFVMLLFAALVFSTMGVYLTSVLPSAGGLRKHPCFCLGSTRKSKQGAVIVEDNDEDEEESKPSRHGRYFEKV